MNVLVLAHFYPPEMGAAAARLHGLSRWLAAFGHRVTVFTCMPNYPAGVIFEGYRGRLAQREMLDGVNVLRTWVYASPRRGALHRLANYFSYVGSAALAGLALREKVDVVLASSPPLFVGAAGWLLARRFRAPWVFDIRDIWPEVAVEAGEFAPDSFVTRWTGALARFLYSRADHLTPVTESKRRKLIEAGVPPEKLTVVSNGVDLDLLEAAPSRDWRGELGLEGRFVVVYAGLIGIAQGVEDVVEAALALRQRPEIHFLIVGDGIRRAAIQERIDGLGLSNLTLLPRQPREAVGAILRAADVAWVPLVSDRLDDAVPSKILEAWGCARPVILSAGGEAAALVQEAAGGTVIPAREPEHLAEAVLALASDRGRLQQLGENGYCFVKGRFERQALARQLERVLLDVTGRGTS